MEQLFSPRFYSNVKRLENQALNYDHIVHHQMPKNEKKNIEAEMLNRELEQLYFH